MDNGVKRGLIIWVIIIAIVIGVVWAADNKTVFYVTKDKETLRADKIIQERAFKNEKIELVGK